MILRRDFLKELSATVLVSAAAIAPADSLMHALPHSAAKTPWIDPATARDWQARWEKNILEDPTRTCIATLNWARSWVAL